MFLMGLLAISAAQPAAPQAELVVPPHRWTVDYSRMACTLVRRLGEERSAILAINAPVGMEPGEFIVMDGGSGLDLRLNGDLGIRLDDGPALAVHARREQRNNRSVVKLLPMPRDFLDRVAGARQLSVSRGDEVVLSLALPDARAAIGELSRCNDDLLHSWGIDVAARRALRREARLTNFDWISNISPSADTFVVFAAEVSETGAPLDCRIVISSRNAIMDRAVCGLVRNRAHFEPALDSAGRPARSQYVTRVRWVVESD